MRRTIAAMAALGFIPGLVSPTLAASLAAGATNPAAAPATTGAAIKLADSKAMSAKLPRGILIYGDSLAIGLSAYAGGAFAAAGLPTPKVEGRIGMKAATGLANLRARCTSLPSTVIVSLGTNDFWLSSTTAEGWVNSLAACAGPQRTIIWVNTYLRPRSAVYAGYRNVNRGLLRAAVRHPNVHIIDWASFVAGGGISLRDGVHPFAAGYRLRANFIATAPLIG